MKKFYYDPSKYDTYLEQLGNQVPDGAVRKHIQPLMNADECG